MEIRRLGWAGVEIAAEGSTVVIEPLETPASVFEGLAEAVLPEVVPASGGACVGLLTHLHRDHADAGALAKALAAKASVLRPAHDSASQDQRLASENLACARAEFELGESDLAINEVVLWRDSQVGPFTLSAVPAVDGLGDPQVSWVIDVGGKRALHCGDTLFHGWWWKIRRLYGPIDVAFLPINGVVMDYPFIQPSSPLPAAMTPEEAAVAAELLGAQVAIPIHYGGFDAAQHYRPVSEAADRFRKATSARGVKCVVLEAGDAVTL